MSNNLFIYDVDNIEELSKQYATKEQFSDLIEKSEISSLKEGSIVEGTIIAIDKDKVSIDIGLKTEGVLSIKEFVQNGQIPDLKIGDKVEVSLEKIESRNGHMVLSREKALRERSWIVFEKCMENGENVDGVICGRVKGGFTVDLNGVVAFLPGSQVDVKPIRDIEPLLNIVQPFQILKVDREQGNIVVSRRAILEESRMVERDALLATLKETDILEGIVKNITDYGAFIDLGSVDGLLHVTDISWSRINHPSELLTVGQKIQVQIIKFNEETKRISLGMKQLEKNPWEGIDQRFPKDKKFSGTVTNITDYGAFIELEKGIEGLVHLSEMTWSKNAQHPKKIVTVGDAVEFVVLEIDINKHRISLGMKQCHENPWVKFAEDHPVGSVIEGEIKNVVDFGIFIGFDKFVDGLVHISDVSWDEKEQMNELKKFAKSDNVKVKVLSIDVDKERISLGIKQLEENPFENAPQSGLKKGAVVTCVVKEITEAGIEVEIEDGVTSFIKRSDLAKEKSDQNPERFAIGDRIDAKVTLVDKSNPKKVSLSIKALEVEQQKQAIAEFGSTDSGASLGDILGAALEERAEKK